MPDTPEILVSSSHLPGRSEEQPATHEPAPAASPPRRRPPLLVVALGLWALLATIAVVVLATWWAPLHNEAQNRQAVQSLATDFVVHLTTFEGEHIDEWVVETQAWATGTYTEQLTRLFDTELRAALREAKVRSEGALLNLFVQEAGANEATVFAVVRQTIDNRFAGEPFDDELRMEITMRREDGSWLVSDVAVLGPGGLAPGAPLEEAP